MSLKNRNSIKYEECGINFTSPPTPYPQGIHSKTLRGCLKLNSTEHYIYYDFSYIYSDKV